MFQPGMDPKAAWNEWRNQINHFDEVRNHKSHSNKPQVSQLSQSQDKAEAVVSEHVKPTHTEFSKCESWDDTLDLINEMIREHGEQPMSAEEIEELRNVPGFDFDEDPFGLADYI